ncbi:hypothetical protein HOE67_04615 [Candidatus Peregrinibacteria bacterium]|nr:hypothetical protein [Candidatus Peregrinibacteria bacterium]MBT4056364.1 hypothetical protein [Candidatus Peregrinibacteria bacterium]
MTVKSVKFAKKVRPNSRRKLSDDDLKMHLQFSEYGMNAKEWLRKCALMLPEIERRKIWKKKKFGSIFEYAAKLAGMSKNQVYDALRIVRKVENLPALRRVVEEKGVNAVRAVATIVTEENEMFWAKKAMEMSARELETYVKDFRGEINRSESLHVKTTEPVKVKTTVTMELDPQTLKQLEKLKGRDGTWEGAIKNLLETREDHLEAEKPEPVKSESNYVPAQISKFVEKRDNCTCVFPGCTKPHYALHHTQGFSRDHIHDPDKLYCVCQSHHSLAHRGLIENENQKPKYWRIREKADSASPRFGLDQLVGEHKRLTFS